MFSIYRYKTISVFLSIIKSYLFQIIHEELSILLLLIQSYLLIFLSINICFLIKSEI